MSGSSVFLYVAATALLSAFIAVCAFQMTAISMERKRSQRCRPLQGPVPGCRSLSTIGVNNRTGRSISTVAGVQTQQENTAGRTRSDFDHTEPACPLSSSTGHSPANLHSPQTIRARSAALQTDGPTARPMDIRPLRPVHDTPTQRHAEEPTQAQEQTTMPPQKAINRSQKPVRADEAQLLPELAADSAGPSIPHKASTSKRGRHPGVRPGPLETVSPATDSAPADMSGLEALGALQTTPPGDFSVQAGDIADLLAPFSEAELGVGDLTDDLSDIDGGALPTPVRKTPQKPKR